MSIMPSRKTSTSKSTAAYASGSGSTPNTTIATAPTRLAAGRFRCTNGSRWTAMRTYVKPKMTRPRVIRVRNAECGVRSGSGEHQSEQPAIGIEPARSTPHSAFHTPHSSYLPIRKQDPALRMRLRIALERHAQIGPADAVPARHQAAERLVVARLAANRHAADAEPRRGGLRGCDRGVECRHVTGHELENPYLIPGPPFRERRRVPQHHGVH